MKKMMIALVTMLLVAVTGKAMSYEQARNEALFLTDKMAYELNLTEDQYEAAYEINLDYLMGVTSYDDVYGTYWERRNLDMSYILLNWQLNAFRAASYFYRPLYWADGFWHFAIYARYPHRDYFYYGRPVFYATYRGAHAWHVTGHSWYHGHRDHYIHHHTTTHFGMRDGWDRGDYRHHHNSGVRHSSTRTTVNHRDAGRQHNSNRNTNNHHNADRGNQGNRPANNATPTESRPTPRSLGGSRSTAKSTNNTRQIDKSASPSTRTNSTSTVRSGSTVSRSSSSSVNNKTNSGSSFSRGSSGSGGSRSTGGGHSFGGRR